MKNVLCNNRDDLCLCRCVIRQRLILMLKQPITACQFFLQTC